MTAKGGNVTKTQAGSGGGGRIAVWQGVPESQEAAILAGDLKSVLVSTNLTAYAGSTSVNPGTGGGYTPLATTGTVSFLTFQLPRGTVIMVR